MTDPETTRLVRLYEKAKALTARLRFMECPTCGAKEDEHCRTPKGRKKKTSAHPTRPFRIA
jgi:hypothetical protein